MPHRAPRALPETFDCSLARSLNGSRFNYNFNSTWFVDRQQIHSPPLNFQCDTIYAFVMKTMDGVWKIACAPFPYGIRISCVEKKFPHFLFIAFIFIFQSIKFRSKNFPVCKNMDFIEKQSEKFPFFIALVRKVKIQFFIFQVNKLK